MSNNIRNKYVIDMNDQSNRIGESFKTLGLDVKNIIETVRNKVFDVSYDLEQHGYDFWDEDFIFRDVLFYYMNTKSLEALQCLKNFEYYYNNFLVSHVMTPFIRNDVRKYEMVTETVAKFDLRKDFYKLVCDYSICVYPDYDKRDKFYEAYVMFCSIGRNIDAVESEEFNNETLFSILDQKVRDSEILRKVTMDPDDLSDEEFLEIIDVALKNYKQMYDGMDTYLADKFDKKLKRARKRINKLK